MIGRRAFLASLGAAYLASCSSAGRSSAETRDEAPDEVSQRIVVNWGKDPLQLAELWLPGERRTDQIGVVALIHGGFWQAQFDRSLMDRLAADVVERGWAAWNLEYRALGSGGGWPATFLDIADGLDALAEQAEKHRLDLSRVAVVGHSAGGTLALWTAGRAKLPADAPGAKPVVKPALVVSQAGVNNLIAGVFEQLGNGAVVDLMGAEPEAAPGDYAKASPAELIPFNVPQVIEYGDDDSIVGVGQSIAYAVKARQAGDEITLIQDAGGSHFTLIDPARRAWERVAVELAKLLDE